MALPFGLSVVEYLAVAVAVTVVAGGGSFLAFRVYRSRNAADFEPERDPSVDEEDVAEGFEAPKVVEPPEMRRTTSRLGLIGELYNMYSVRRKQRKLLGRGYVRWFLVDDVFPRAKYVKPKLEKGGVPEYKIGDERYLFPREGALPDQDSGLWTFVHQKGDADPLNLSEPKDHTLPADAVQEWTTMRPSASPPSWFDSFGWDMGMALRALIIFVILYAGIRAAISNGLLG